MKAIWAVKTLNGEPSRDQTSVGLSKPFVLGRKNADFPLNDRYVSAAHAVVYFGADGVIVLRDLDSRNGTFLNGRRVEKAVLSIGDVVTVGLTEIELIDIEQTDTREKTDLNIEKPPVVHYWPELYECQLPQIKIKSSHAQKA